MEQGNEQQYAAEVMDELAQQEYNDRLRDAMLKERRKQDAAILQRIEFNKFFQEVK